VVNWELGEHFYGYVIQVCYLISCVCLMLVCGVYIHTTLSLLTHFDFVVVVVVVVVDDDDDDLTRVYMMGAICGGVQDEYAAQVADPRTYHAICRDIVRRWVFPLVPDAHILTDTTYVQGKQHNYREDSVKVARSARIGQGVVLGRGSVVEEHAVISHCIVGRNCVVGRGAVLKESHLWEGVVVEGGASVTHSIIGERSIVRAGASVSRGCVLSSGVVVGAGVTLPEYTRVGSCRHPDEEVNAIEIAEWREYVLMCDGVWCVAVCS
jgi:NDP-sugar pyrophosphorylase family protein